MEKERKITIVCRWEKQEDKEMKRRRNTQLIFEKYLRINNNVLKMSWSIKWPPFSGSFPLSVCVCGMLYFAFVLLLSLLLERMMVVAISNICNFFSHSFHYFGYSSFCVKFKRDVFFPIHNLFNFFVHENSNNKLKKIKK